MYKFRKRVHNILDIGNKSDALSVAVDIFIVISIFINLAVTLGLTFNELEEYYGVMNVVELITIIIFAVEYVLRVWTADFEYPNLPRYKAALKFIFSFYGLIDFWAFFPYFLPLLFSTGTVAVRAFRIIRVIRIFRLFKINSQYDAFNVISDVLNEKKSQIISSVCLILVFMVASSLCMYSLENEAQPEVFSNAFSGIWWSVSTLLTVGYGDIYPITPAGKIFAIIISFLGVGMVAIPTGIISAGFVEKYTDIRSRLYNKEERSLKFVTSEVEHGHSWCNKVLSEIVLPPHFLVVIIFRGEEEVVPHSNTKLLEGDIIVLGAAKYEGEDDIELKEIIIKEENSWVGKAIKDIDISRRQIILAIKRKNKTIVPNGNTILRKDDHLFIYTKTNN